jgi:hypothetical protein
MDIDVKQTKLISDISIKHQLPSSQDEFLDNNKKKRVIKPNLFGEIKTSQMHTNKEGLCIEKFLRILTTKYKIIFFQPRHNMS